MTLREQLKQDEGLRLRPYRDTRGKLTIGYGRNLDDVGISVAEAEVLLDHDIECAQRALKSHMPAAEQMSDRRREALVNLCFNMGIGGLLRCTQMLDAIDRGDWNRAAAELLDSAYYRQVGVRAERLAEDLRQG